MSPTNSKRFKISGNRLRASVFFWVAVISLSCSGLKLDKGTNCLNQNSGCFNPDFTSPKFQSAVSPAENELVSVLSTVDLMFSEELNNPQPSDFVFTGAASITVNAVQKLNSYIYRLILTQNSLNSGTITLSFPNLKDYNGNKISGPTSVTYIGNVDLPVTIPLVNPSGVNIQNPSHEGISNLNNTPSGAGGYNAIDVYWYYTYVPPDGSTTTYSIKRTTGATDCNSATTIGSFTVAPTPAVGPVNSYDATNVTTKTNTTYKFTLKPVAGELPLPPPPQIYQTILICVDNVINNKHGKAVLNLIRDDSRPATSLSPLAPAAPVTSTPPIPTAASNVAKTLTFNCSDNVDRILYSSTSTIGTGVVPLLGSVTDPAFDPLTGAVLSGNLYDTNNKPVTPYGGTSGDNPTITTYKYLCIDKSGNIENGVKSAVYEIDSSLPSVTLAHVYKTGTTKEITGVSPSGYTSADFIWHTNQINKYWEIRRGATSCGTGGTIVASATTTGLTTPSPADTPVTTQITPASPGIAVGENQLLLCVGNNTAFASVTKWGQESFTLLRADGPLALPQVNIAAGNYGAQQNLVFTCDPTTVDKIAYMEASVAGAGSPTPPTANPDFTPNGDLDTTIIGNTLFSAPVKTADASTTVYKIACIDRAGNKSSPLTTGNYRIDSVLPTITVVSNSREALSSTSGYTTTTLIWRSSRGGLPYRVKQPGTACAGSDLTTGTNLTGSATPTDVSQAISTTIDVANFGAEGTYDIQICVQNFIGQWGYTSYTLRKDITPPNIIAAYLTPSISLVSGNTFSLSWNAAADTGAGVAVYRIFRDTATTPTFPGYPNSPDYIAAATPGLNSTNITMPDASKYYLRIVPVDAAGNPTALASSYNYIATRLNLSVSVTGYTTGSGDFRVQQGSDILAFNTTPGGTQNFSSALTPGSSYSIAVVAQPSNQICSFIANQFGTISNDLTLNVKCLPGQWVGGDFQSAPPVPLNYLLYRGKVTTLAGNGSPGFADNATGTLAQFQNPEFLVYLNNSLYVADSNSRRVRKVSLTAPYTVTTAAGNAAAAAGDATDDNSVCTLAKFGVISAIGTDGTNLYVSEFSPAKRIRKISDMAGTCSVSTFAGSGTAGYVDGPAATARFSDIYDIVSDGSNLYVAESGNARIRKIDLATGNVSTIAGNGGASSTDASTGTSASFVVPTGLTIIGTDLYVGDICFSCSGTDGNKIRKVSLVAPYPVTTVAGVGGVGGFVDGPAATARFNKPISLATDGTHLFVADFDNSAIRRLDPTKGFRVSTLAGTGSTGQQDGVGPTAILNNPHGIATDGRTLYISEWGGHRIKKIVDSGLVGYWPIDPGVNPNDYSSDNTTALNGSLTGGPLSTLPDRFGNANRASRFSGTQYITTATTGLPTGNAARTMCAWFKPASTPTGNNIIATYGNMTTNQSFGVYISYAFGTQWIGLTAFGGLPDDMLASHIISTTEWSHICASTDGTTARLYLNGKLMASGARTFATGTGGLRIGTQQDGSQGFSGGIADVRLYNRTLNEGEINELAQNAVSTEVGQTFSTAGTGLVAHYEFNQGAEDLPTGSVGGSLTYTGTKTPVNGKDGDAGGSLYLNGASYTSGSGLGLPVGKAPRTLCAWIRLASQPAGSIRFPIISYGTPALYFDLVYFNAGSTAVPDYRLALSDSGNSMEQQVVLPINTWQHACMTHDSTTASIYLNGGQILSAAHNLTNVTSASLLNVGKRTVTSAYFNGAIDDVRIYNNALTGLQIRQLATQVSDGLVFRLDMNGDFSDVSGFGHTAASNPGSLTTGRRGIANTAYRFLANQQAQFAHSPHLLQQANISWSFWMKSPDMTNIGGEIIGKYINTPISGWVVKYDQSNFAHAWTAGSGGQGAFSNSHRVPSSNVWNHYAYVRSGAGMTVYINGKSYSNILAGDGTPIVPNTVNITLGLGSSTGEIALQDMRVYNRALAISEVQALSGYHAVQTATGLSLHVQADTFSNLSTGNNITSNWTNSVIQTPVAGSGTVGGTPRYVAGASSLLGGAPAVEFDGTAGKYFDFGFPTYSYSGLTVCTAATRRDNNYRGLVEKRGAVAAVNSWGMLNDLPTSALKFEMDSTASTEVVTPIANDTPSIYCAISGAGNVLSSFVNGQTGASIGKTIMGGSNSDRLVVGARFDLASSYFGQIGDVLVLTKDLTPVERRVVECYLSAKYSIPLTGGAVCP